METVIGEVAYVQIGRIAGNGTDRAIGRLCRFLFNHIRMGKFPNESGIPNLIGDQTYL